MRYLLKAVIEFGISPKKVFVFDDYEEFKKSCKKYYNTEIENDKNTISGLSYGTHFWVEDKNYLPVVIHEIIHVVDYWIEDLGFKNDSELRAYAVQGILEKYLKIIKK